MSMSVGSLFTGIGGLDLGFERAGFQIAWQVEIDPYCRRVLRKHWPTVPCYEDIRDVGAHNLAPVDVLVGGFPCQPVSLAGKGKAEDDHRWLWPEYRRLLSELRPRYAVIENVPGLVPRGLRRVLTDLADCLYDAEGVPLPAAAFGAPHIRERLFIVAYPQGGEDRGIQQRYVFPDTGRGFSLCGATITNSVNGKARVGHLTFWEEALLSEEGNGGDVLWVQAVNRFAGMDDGLPAGIYRSRARALGNAVVPQVAQYVAECIREHAVTFGDPIAPYDKV